MTMTPALERLLRQTYQAERHHFWFRGFRRFVRPLLAQAAAGRTDLQLLDCGCGTGANLGLLAPYGTTYGVDLVRVGLEFAAQAYGERRLAQASVTHLPLPSGHFDVVTSFDVLYCLPDGADEAAVAEFHRVLRPGGALVMNVAAMPVLSGVHSVAAAEVRRYRRAELRAMLSRAGFAIERLTFTNATLFPVLLVQRALERARGLPPGPHDAGNQLTVPPSPVNALFTAALVVESHLLRYADMPVGSSLLVLAHKEA